MQGPSSTAISMGSNSLEPFMVGVSPFKAAETSNRSNYTIGRPAVGDDRLETVHGKPLQTPAFAHVMSLPSDRWELNTTGVPSIRVLVERMKLNRGGFIDVVDFYME